VLAFCLPLPPQREGIVGTKAGSKPRKRASPMTRCVGCNRERLGTFVRDGPDGQPSIRLGFCCISAVLAVRDPYRLATLRMLAVGWTEGRL